MSKHHLCTCPYCKTQHYVPDVIYQAAYNSRNGRCDCIISVYCPYGHGWVFKADSTITEEDAIRRERDRLKQQIAQKEDEVKNAWKYFSEEQEKRKHAERSASTYKGKVTRLKNRAAAGVCPCCTRTFQNLANHMKHQHPDFKKDDEKAA